MQTLNRYTQLRTEDKVDKPQRR